MAELSRSGKIVISALFALLAVMGAAVEASTFHFIWEAKYKSPEKMNITVNGESQAPTFFAQKNDVIILQVTNGFLTGNLAVHLAGVGQIENPRLGVPQNPVLPGETVKYEFVVNKPGKYIYDYYGTLKSEAEAAALYISIHVFDRKPEPFLNDFDQSIYEKIKPLHSSPTMKKRAVAVRFQAKNPGIYDNYEGFTPPEAPPSHSTILSLKNIIILIGASLTISLALTFRIICICCPRNS